MFDVRDPVTWNCKREIRLAIRYLERMKLRTSYPAVVDRIRDVAMDPSLGERPTLMVDATGVGAPVVDLLRAAKMDCSLVAFSITGGERTSRDVRGGTRRVPKRDLVTGLQLIFDQQKLYIANGLAEDETLMDETLMKELMAMRVKVWAAGHDSYGNVHGGSHDDLVLAVAFACWRAGEPRQCNWYGGKPG
jgi:hypothetical protein